MSFCPEDKLLLACAGAPFRPNGHASVRDLLDSDLDWQYVLETSIRHAVSPLVHAALVEAAAPDELFPLIPAAVREELHRLYDMTGARSRRLYAELAEIARSFRRAGIEAVALKEIPLALNAFPELAQRPIGDLDILIRAGDYERAVEALGGRGYEPVPLPELPFTRKYACAHHLRRAEDEVWVDLQWNLAEREFDLYGEGTFTFDPEVMWDRAVPLALEPDAVFAAPRPEPMLFHLCLHAEGHGYSEIVLFADVAALLHREAIDWDEVAALAERYGAEASVYYVLVHAQRLLGAEVPNEALHRLEPAYVDGPLANAIFENLTPLHLALDDARSHARPPTAVAAAMEGVVREQAVAAMALSREVNDVVRGFKERGGGLVVLTGASSERIYPDAALAPFGPITAVVLVDDLPHLTESLDERGFVVHGSEDDRRLKRVAIESRDPVLRDHPVELDLEWVVAREWTRADVLRDPGRRSKKKTALALIRRREDAENGSGLGARVDVLALNAEDALAYLAARLGAEEDGRLFGLWTLAEVARAAPQALEHFDADAFRVAVARSGCVTEVCDGLAIAEELLSGALSPASAALACAPRHPRVLEWARYGPGTLGSHAGFKRAFFMLYTLKALAGGRERTAYLRRALLGGRDHRSLASALLSELGGAALTALRPRTVASRDLAVWIEPPGLVSERDVQEHDEGKNAHRDREELVSRGGEQHHESAEHEEDEQDLH